MLSDSNSTQDAFTDPTSSQDSSHKNVFRKASSSSSESTTPVKDGHSTSEDTRTCLSRRVCPLSYRLCVLIELVFNSSVASQGEHFGVLTEEKVIQEVVECVVVTLPETPKVTVDSCPQPPPVPATPPKLPGPSLQAAPQTPAAEGKKKPEPPAEVIEVPKSLPAGAVEQRRMLVEMCVRGLFLCLSRFPQHYKSLYRLAFFYTNSKTHQVSLRCGCGIILVGQNVIARVSALVKVKVSYSAGHCCCMGKDRSILHGSVRFPDKILQWRKRSREADGTVFCIVCTYLTPQLIKGIHLLRFTRSAVTVQNARQEEEEPSVADLCIFHESM